MISATQMESAIVLALVILVEFNGASSFHSQCIFWKGPFMTRFNRSTGSKDPAGSDGTVRQERTIFTERVGNAISLRPNRPALVISSTSWWATFFLGFSSYMELLLLGQSVHICQCLHHVYQHGWGNSLTKKYPSTDCYQATTHLGDSSTAIWGPPLCFNYEYNRRKLCLQMDLILLNHSYFSIWKIVVHSHVHGFIDMIATTSLSKYA